MAIIALPLLSLMMNHVSRISINLMKLFMKNLILCMKKMKFHFVWLPNIVMIRFYGIYLRWNLTLYRFPVFLYPWKICQTTNFATRDFTCVNVLCCCCVEFTFTWISNFYIAMNVVILVWISLKALKIKIISHFNQFTHSCISTDQTKSFRHNI